MTSQAETELQKAQRASLGHGLFTVARLLDELAQQEVNAEAGAVVARPALMRLLPFLDFHGIRPSDLARRVDVSKQAIHQALSDLVAQGFVEYAQDPEDGRARLVRMTAKGGQGFRHGLGVLNRLEDLMRDEVGDGKIEALREALGALWPVLERWKQTGLPSRNPAHLKRRSRQRRP